MTLYWLAAGNAPGVFDDLLGSVALRVAPAPRASLAVKWMGCEVLLVSIATRVGPRKLRAGLLG